MENGNNKVCIDELMTKYDKVTGQILSPLFCHCNCLSKARNQDIEPVMSEVYTKHVIPLINDVVLNSCYIFLSDIRHRLEKLYPDIVFHNKAIKKFLMGTFSDSLSFCKPYKASDSTIVYPSHISTEDIVAKIQHLNILQSAGSIIRESLMKDVNFGLEDSFCDHIDLLDSWRKTKMPETLMDFFLAFLI